SPRRTIKTPAACSSFLPASLPHCPAAASICDCPPPGSTLTPLISTSTLPSWSCIISPIAVCPCRAVTFVSPTSRSDHERESPVRGRALRLRGHERQLLPHPARVRRGDRRGALRALPPRAQRARARRRSGQVGAGVEAAARPRPRAASAAGGDHRRGDRGAIGGRPI